MRRGNGAVATAGRPLPVTALYEVVLLAGTPRRLSLRLAPDLAREDVVEVDGEPWTVADVRTSDGGTVQLICIYPD